MNVALSHSGLMRSGASTGRNGHFRLDQFLGHHLDRGPDHLLADVQCVERDSHRTIVNVPFAGYSDDFHQAAHDGTSTLRRPTRSCTPHGVRPRAVQPRSCESFANLLARSNETCNTCTIVHQNYSTVPLCTKWNWSWRENCRCRSWPNGCYQGRGSCSPH